MAPTTLSKRIGVYKQTHDSFATRVDTARTNTLNCIFYKCFSQYGGVSPVNISSFKLPEKNNEALRTAVYQYHLENQLSGIIGLRVIKEKETSIVYYNNKTYSDLYAPLNKIITPLNCKQVSLITNFVLSVTKELREGIIREWAMKKGISTNFKRMETWVGEQLYLFGGLESTLGAEYPKRRNVEVRRTTELNEIVNQFAKLGYIPETLAKQLKQSRTYLKSFVSEERLHDMLGALRLLSTAAAASANQYSKRVGTGSELLTIMLEEIDIVQHNLFYPKAQREILRTYTDKICDVLQNDDSAEHVPLFYVPIRESSDHMQMDYLPCMDVQLTVKCADKVLTDARYQGDFSRVILLWANKL